MKTRFIFLSAFLFTFMAAQAQTTFSYAGRGGNPNPTTSSGMDGLHNTSGNQKDHIKSTETVTPIHINKDALNEHYEHPDRKRRNDKIYHPYNTNYSNGNPQDGVKK